MIEILFRAKTTDEVRGFKFAPNGTWVYGFYADKVGLPVIYQFEQSRADYVDYEIDRKTLGQYIGVTDRNEKQIFEDDIVKYHYETYDYAEDFIGVIKYFNGSFGIEDIEKKHFLTFNDMSVYIRWFEIIGNIHDNPELLKEVE